MTDGGTAGIRIRPNGPYLVEGGVPLSVLTIVTDDEGGSTEFQPGRSFEVTERYALCRCGGSKTKPFCDASHKENGFDGTETASRVPYAEQAKTFDGPTLVLQDAEALCAFARFCDPQGSIWNLVAESDDPDKRAIAVREGMHCPSGRLVLRDKVSGTAIEPALDPSIAVLEDPGKRCSGPLWVRGGIAITSADGTTYEARNRVALCRCGASNNKPFCDGTHADIGFKDGL